MKLLRLLYTTLHLHLITSAVAVAVAIPIDTIDNIDAIDQGGICGNPCESLLDCGQCPRGKCYGGTCVSTRGTRDPMFPESGFQSREEVTEGTGFETKGDINTHEKEGRGEGARYTSNSDCPAEFRERCDVVKGLCVVTCPPEDSANDHNCTLHGVEKRDEEVVTETKTRPTCNHQSDCSMHLRTHCVAGHCVPICLKGAADTPGSVLEKREDQAREVLERICHVENRCRGTSDCDEYEHCFHGCV